MVFAAISGLFSNECLLHRTGVRVRADLCHGSGKQRSLEVQHIPLPLPLLLMERWNKEHLAVSWKWSKVYFQSWVHFIRLWDRGCEHVRARCQRSNSAQVSTRRGVTSDNSPCECWVLTGQCAVPLWPGGVLSAMATECHSGLVPLGLAGGSPGLPSGLETGLCSPQEGLCYYSLSRYRTGRYGNDSSNDIHCKVSI